ncbi:glycerate kinase family protein [Butyrivibrio sp. VCD2006]|uniref:glycerate kinase family protein n=1 Tax=Butyrivibrio sp. VCD2006 TaxID=1280664 RepID=UPI000403CF01|nr:glycerate kinase [Butyrivibrio sp. VCD2006]
MKIVAAFDSFKGSLSSIEAGNAAKEGFSRVSGDVETVVRPLADGGEGTVYALVTGTDGRFEDITVTGPLLEKVSCRYGIIQNDVAVVEMSSAAGITLVTESKRNPLHTTTYGVGEIILDAINKGCRKFIIGIGGSATNDGGVGMLMALGFDFLDENGDRIVPGAEGLKHLKTISCKNASLALSECSFQVACDVTNPLCGANGCSVVFGPQKGATPEMIEDMDRWLGNYAALSKEIIPEADPDMPGSGAAGGMGFALRTFLSANLESGIDIIIRETFLEDYIKDADFVVTGEGMLDAQTAMGKAPAGVARLAKKYGKPVIAISGAVSDDAAMCNKQGIDAFFPALRKVCTLDEAMEKETAERNIADTAEQVLRIIYAFRK